MRKERHHDLILKSGAFVDFKVSRDKSNNLVISSITIGFEGAEVPRGGITASTLREIRTSELLVNWFDDNPQSKLTLKQEEFLWGLLINNWKAKGREGVDPISYANLAFFYIKYCENYPNNPTNQLAIDMGIPVKTLQTRLSKARKLGMLTSGAQGVGKAMGALTPLGRKSVGRLVNLA